PKPFRRHSRKSGNLEMKSNRNLSEMTETERTGSRFCGNDGDRVAVIVDEQKPVRRCLALAQREQFSKVLKHQVNRFRTICTVCGFVVLS
ncbi:hypothetical protein, partial [Neisseria meningitidis]|uniref:hypothetical protein n=1 Tax=Neisseria meningitidis TaxID=487 RepID=UPI001C5636DA